MKLQHRLITDYLQELLSGRGIDFDNDNNEFDNMVVRKVGRLNEGENIALIIVDGICTNIFTLACIDNTFNIEENDIVVPYSRLERLLHDYIETAREFYE